ncbi:MAG: hypothetical protein RLZZ224_967 [Verrucomicrobiota bacterium]
MMHHQHDGDEDQHRNKIEDELAVASDLSAYGSECHVA